MQTIELNTKELSQKYGLAEWIIKEETEKTVSRILTESFGFEVTAQFREKPNHFEIFGYPEEKGQLKEVKINPSFLKGKSFIF